MSVACLPGLPAECHFPAVPHGESPALEPSHELGESLQVPPAACLNQDLSELGVAEEPLPILEDLMYGRVRHFRGETPDGVGRVLTSGQDPMPK